MSRSILDLTPTCRAKAEALLVAASDAGLQLEIYCTHRTLADQAMAYRRGRTLRLIRRKAQDMDEMKSGLGEIIRRVGPQHGSKITGAAPGQSAHYYGMAFDATPVVGGKWFPDADDPSWQGYGELTVGVGLEWAGHWRRGREFPHSQLTGFDWRVRIKAIRKVDIDAELDLL